MRPLTARPDPLIPLGIVGGGADWAKPYWPAIAALKRGRVVAAYSSQRDEADLLGQALATPRFLSLREMLRKTQLGALLILDTGVSRDWAVQLAAERQIPAFVASPIDDHLPARIAQLADQEVEGLSLIPGLTLRMTPASLRLRELIATRLGPVQRILIERHPTSGPHLISVIDWCRSIIGSVTSHIERSACDQVESWQLQCGRRSPLAPMVISEIVHSGVNPHPWSIRVQCERGEAHLAGETQIHWQTTSEKAEEQLQSDRTAEQVLLDLFLRRVVGGVVPIPSWAELAEACRLWKHGIDR